MNESEALLAVCDVQDSKSRASFFAFCSAVPELASSMLAMQDHRILEGAAAKTTHADWE